MNTFGKDPNKMRLQVFLSRSGACSRREAMKIVQSGRVSLNGRINREPSTQIDPSQDEIQLDGKKIISKNSQYILLNKPTGYVTTKKDPHVSETVYDLLPKQWRHLKAVGRLDKNTEGLLIFTNDGELANRLTHPKFAVKKEYFVIVEGQVGEKAIEKLKKGMYINGKKTASSQVKVLKRSKEKTHVSLKIREGRKRQVRLMFDNVGHPVLYLKRVTQGPLKLGDLKTGKWRFLNDTELRELKQL